MRYSARELGAVEAIRHLVPVARAPRHVLGVAAVHEQGAHPLADGEAGDGRADRVHDCPP